MRQRNDTANALHVSAWPTDDDPGRTPFDVQSGEEIDFPQLLAGFTGIEPALAETAQQIEPAAPKTRVRATADAKGGEAR